MVACSSLLFVVENVETIEVCIDEHALLDALVASNRCFVVTLGASTNEHKPAIIDEQSAVDRNDSSAITAL